MELLEKSKWLDKYILFFLQNTPYKRLELQWAGNHLL